MSIANFPTVLQAAIQQNFLKREFEDGLQSQLGYREVAIKVKFPVNIGETWTSTKTSMLTPSTDPLNPQTNTGLDNGMAVENWLVEQFTMTLNMYGKPMDLNLFTQRVGIADQFLQNAKKLGVQAGQTIDRLAANTLRTAYLGGATRTTATLGAPAATIAVDDIRGFYTVFVNGVLTPVSVTNVLVVSVNGTNYNLTGVAADVTNVSTAAIVGGISGTLTFSTNVSVLNSTVGNAVTAIDAPLIVRPNSRLTTALLQDTDFLTMKEITAAVTQLERNSVPKINGMYNLYLDSIQLNELYQDPVFLQWHRGQNDSPEYQTGVISRILGVKILKTTESWIQTAGTTVVGGVHRAILCGEGTLYEGDYAGTEGYARDLGDNQRSIIDNVDGVLFITRPPLDRLAQIVSQSWLWAGGFVAPTDSLATTAIIPTATAGRYKRAVIIESA